MCSRSSWCGRSRTRPQRRRTRLRGLVGPSAFRPSSLQASRSTLKPVTGTRETPLVSTDLSHHEATGRMNRRVADGIALARFRDERYMRVRELLRHLEDDGWQAVRQSAELRQLCHFQRPGIVTIVGDETSELPAGTLRSVFAPASHAGRETPHEVRSGDRTRLDVIRRVGP
jgi:predicted RNA binding protein YcfA (HicA-like mRNA interferase family)